MSSEPTLTIEDYAREFWAMLIHDIDKSNWNPILEFLRAHPEVAKAPYSISYDPLHWVCYLKPPRAVAEEFLLAFPNASRIKSRGGNFPLHELLFDVTGDRYRYFVGENVYLRGDVDLKVNEEVLRLLLIANHDAARTKNSNDELPLHLAAKNVLLPLKSLKILIAAYPEAAGVIDSASGDYPIHSACRWWTYRQHDNLSEKMKVLIAANPDALLAKDNQGQLPLNRILICRQEKSGKEHINAIKMICSANSQAAGIADNDGNMPFHLANSIWFNNLPNELFEELISFLFTAHPRVALHQNNQGQLPLHLACKHWPKNCWKILGPLVANPRAIRTADNDDKTPLDYAMSRELDSKEFVAELFSLCDTGIILNQLQQTSIAFALAMGENKSLKVENKSLKEHIRSLEKEGVDSAKN